jgi:hypothetical protein
VHILPKSICYVGAGEGNRTLVISLEGIRASSNLNAILTFGRLSHLWTPKEKLALSERARRGLLVSDNTDKAKAVRLEKRQPDCRGLPYAARESATLSEAN